MPDLRWLAQVLIPDVDYAYLIDVIVNIDFNQPIVG
jgi:hypothetical protein